MIFLANPSFSMAPFVVSIFYDRARLYHMLLLISQGYTRARANAWLGEKERNVSVVAEYGEKEHFALLYPIEDL